MQKYERESMELSQPDTRHCARKNISFHHRKRESIASNASTVTMSDTNHTSIRMPRFGEWNRRNTTGEFSHSSNLPMSHTRPQRTLSWSSSLLRKKSKKIAVQSKETGPALQERYPLPREVDIKRRKTLDDYNIMDDDDSVFE